MYEDLDQDIYKKHSPRVASLFTAEDMQGCSCCSEGWREARTSSLQGIQTSPPGRVC